jgi:N-acetylneuraminic acid mutarotase
VDEEESHAAAAHHAALAAANGKVYVMGGFVPPKDTAIPVGGAWEPIDNAWEYDPAADSWKPLAPAARQARALRCR